MAAICAGTIMGIGRATPFAVNVIVPAGFVVAVGWGMVLVMVTPPAAFVGAVNCGIAVIMFATMFDSLGTTT
jgi:hypothetical protein